MFEYNKKSIENIALNTNFNKNMIEKVLRLLTILQIINSKEIGQMLVLKGGTAINIFMMNVPRLSVDIDFDFNINCSKEEMVTKRKIIDESILEIMKQEGYELKQDSKFVHSLDSYVYSYRQTTGGIDTLKIEINYSDRIHVFNPSCKSSSLLLPIKTTIAMLKEEELIGSKLSALLKRTTARDIYDVYNLYSNNMIKNPKLVKRIAIFYVCSSMNIPFDFNELLDQAINKVKNITFNHVKRTLIPLLHKGLRFDTIKMSNYVADFLTKTFILDNEEKQFIDDYNQKLFHPDLLFKEFNTNDLSNHPMIQWKIK